MATSRLGSRWVSYQTSTPFRGELAEPGGDIVGLVVEGQVGAERPAELDCSGLPAEVATRAPAALAIWTTIEPTPPLPPGT